MNSQPSGNGVKNFTPTPHLLSAQIAGHLLLIIEAGSDVEDISIAMGSRKISGQPVAATDNADRTACRRKKFMFPLPGLPACCALTVRASLADGNTENSPLQISRRLLPATAQYPSPIMVTSVGRCGSTLLMQMLAAHPDIAVVKEYPMEATLARKQFGDVVNGFPGLYADMAEYGVSADLLESGLFSKTAAMAGDAVMSASNAYTSVHRRQTGQTRSPVFYAEKNLSPEYLVWELCAGAREIFLVRDPRDMICSTLSFNAKRGTVKFGRQEVVSDLEYVAHRAAMARPWTLEPWKARGDRAMLVKYEELVTAPLNILRRLFRYLDLNADDALLERVISSVASEKQIVDRHATTSTPADSIGRWRKDLSPEMLESCNREFADFIEIFGYAKKNE